MSKRTALIVLAGCGVGLVFPFAGVVFLNHREADQLRAEGLPVTATVVEKTSQKIGWRQGSGDVLHRCVRLSFQTRENQPAGGETCDYVWQEDWDALHPGDQVRALYLPKSVHAVGDALGAEVHLETSLAHR